MNPKICAIIVSAWKASAWIKDCVESINKQRPTLAWEYDLRLGIDGCHETRAVVKEMGQKFYWNPVNAGVYLMRNSLIQLAPADAYAVFDADDMMMDTYLNILLPLM